MPQTPDPKAPRASRFDLTRLDLSGRFELFLVGLSLAVLSLCCYFAFLGISLPKRNLPWDPGSWIVFQDQDDCADESRCLRVGDRILAIDGISLEELHADRGLAIFTEAGPSTLEVSRGGQGMTLSLDWRRPTRVQTLEMMVSSAFPLLFWLAGTLASILVRPRDTRWATLLAFYYVAAIFFSAGSVSYTQQAGSFYVSHLGAAFFVPLLIHLHLILPRRFDNRLARSTPPVLYSGAVVLAAWDFFVRPLSPQGLSLLIGSGMVVVAIILAFRLGLPSPPGTRSASRLMVIGTLLGLAPLWLLLVTQPLEPLADLPYGTDNLLVVSLVALMLPNWPLSYLYAIYKLDTGRIRLRANRALASYGFWSLFLTSYVILFLAAAHQWSILERQPILASLAFSFIFVAITPYLRRVFRRFIDRHILGIRFEPREILSLFAERIPITFDSEILRRTLCDRILPTLMVRQSALYLFHKAEPFAGDPSCELLYAQNVPSDGLAEGREQVEDLSKHLPGPMVDRPSGKLANGPFAWIQLAIPLGNRGDWMGMWFLGRRDPDDAYPPEDVSLLMNLANQMASVLSTHMEKEENRRLQNQLIQSQKMEAIGRLSAGVAHDFNNLLSAILGYSDLLLDPAHGGDPRAPSYVEGIKEAGEKAAALTTQLLAFSRQQVMAPQVVSLNSVVEHLEALLRRVIEEDIDLRTELDPETPSVCLDPGQLEQVLLNLAVNASDAMPEGGELTISTRVEICGLEHACPAEVPPGEWVVLSVSDSGMGIDPKLRDRIFEPFFTTKNLGEGTGLGLSMVYGIVSQSKGYIFVESEPGRGTTFELYLPGVDEVVAQAESGPQAVLPRHQAEKETVLLAEDEENVRKVVAEVLRSRGYSVLIARDGREAMEIAEAHEGVIDLLLTDVMMPRMKGPELANLLLEQRPGTAVLFMSGYNEDSILGEKLRSGNAVLLPKPFTPQQLDLEVRAALERARMGSEADRPVADAPSLGSPQSRPTSPDSSQPGSPDSG